MERFFLKNEYKQGTGGEPFRKVPPDQKRVRWQSTVYIFIQLPAVYFLGQALEMLHLSAPNRVANPESERVA